MNSCGMMATDSRKMENDQRTSTKVKLYLKMSARIAEGPMRYPMRNVSMAGSCRPKGMHSAESRACHGEQSARD